MPDSEPRREDSLRSYRESGAVPEAPPLKIAHISDLHFLTLGLPERFKRWLRKHHMGDQSEQVLHALRSQIMHLEPDIVVASGDLTTLGDKASMVAVDRFLRELVQNQCKLPFDRLVMIPGNHDSLLRYTYLKRSRAFDSVFGSCVLFREMTVRGYPVFVFCFDSSIDRRGEWWPFTASKGRIEPDVFIEFNDQIYRLRKDDVDKFQKALKIAVVHHHPLPVPHKELESFTIMQNGGTFIAHMQSNGINLILHGHEHFPYGCSYCFEQKKEAIIVISAGTASQNGTLNNSFNFFEFQPWKKLSLKQFDYWQTGFSENFNASKTFWFRSRPTI